MNKDQKPSQRELADALDLTESQVVANISAVERKPDGSGHWVYFVPDAEPELISKLGVGRSGILGTDAINRLRGD
ncbi:hypothetical protein [Pseudomonas purpurea]|uniref:hypothetical protein n=1 Tax=Pseudomonas purpurea TaxID=3136737 RepID=UPI003266F8B3